MVGAGPAGLAVAACLQRRGVPHVLVERAAAIAPAWRGHYDRLHLHTNRRLSGLPHLPMPSSYPRYPTRDQVVAYLDRYAVESGLDPHLGVQVTAVTPQDGAWTVETTIGTVESEALVVSTGYNGAPVLPSWPGMETFPGPIVHSSAYRNGRPHRAQDVLVVGFGNSGGEIALDLHEHGASPTIAVRGAVNVIPRDMLGMPILAVALALSRLPPRVADAISWPLLKAHYPSYRALGLRKARHGPFTQIARTSKVPLLDIGTIREIRRGNIRVAPGLERFSGRCVSFTDGTEREFDAVVLATGYGPAVRSFLPDGLGVTDGDGVPTSTGRESAVRGLYFCGFYVAPTGMFREIGIEAKHIAGIIARRSHVGGVGVA